MKSNIFSTIRNKEDYLTVFDAITNTKPSYTEDEKAKLLSIYTENAASELGFSDDTLIKAILVLDIPAVNLLNKADMDALSALSALYVDWELDVEKAHIVKDAALNGGVTQSLAISMARATLDVYLSQNDIAKYQKDINSLSEFLKQADAKIFSDACAFLIRVRERVRTR